MLPATAEQHASYTNASPYDLTRTPHTDKPQLYSSAPPTLEQVVDVLKKQLATKNSEQAAYYSVDIVKWL